MEKRSRDPKRAVSHRIRDYQPREFDHGSAAEF
jgi:hypothetical protein